ncbi:FAD-dependent oxidoreductase [Leptolyngbya sp. 7M]|uniref:FAD-dependent oxidoreductase n=1 Tax=Leptolyngbya sp. 7M TaxID=2812896 RepID=UPI001B8CE9FD|nr:FAD-dependent oxidoreductase [Leptolyngbya sp. 7M]QYO64063.1 FAD-binding oxidoreductase [Leptolyngbya sp. 7M]
MTTDWIVVGNGLAGAALSYELQKSGFSVLLLDRSDHPESGTRYSYGGIAYWSGTTALMQQLCQEGITLHRQLSAELESDTQPFSEIPKAV